MVKCDFCEKSDSNGKCYYTWQRSAKEDACKAAIKRMTKALKCGGKRMR